MDASIRGTARTMKTVAVIGAGPSGIAAAKHLLSEGATSEIVIFEQRSNVGGIWNADATSPPNDVAAFPSPIYHGMESNIPSEIMQFDRRPFPEGTPLLADAGQVLKYIQDYGKGVLHLVRYRQQVTDVSANLHEDGPYWRLRVHDLDSHTVLEHCYDAVIVANGRYNKIYEPCIPGIDCWKRLNPQSVLHSKFFRDPEDFRGKKLVIVGFSSSGVDIANAVASLCASPLLISQKSSAGVSPGAKCFEQGRVILPPIIEVNAERRSVLFANGHEESDVDCIMFCTGYDYEYPFLSGVRGFGPGGSDGNTRIYQHIFHVDHPTLAFVMLPLRVVAFPFAETQAAVIARVWSGRLCLPPREEMASWVEANKKSRGECKGFHKLSYPADAEYMNEMYRWCMSAEGETESHIRPPFWGPREKWLRQTLHDIRRATEARGEERFMVKSVMDAGFEFSDGTAD